MDIFARTLAQYHRDEETSRKDSQELVEAARRFTPAECHDVLRRGGLSPWGVGLLIAANNVPEGLKNLVERLDVLQGSVYGEDPVLAETVLYKMTLENALEWITINYVDHVAVRELAKSVGRL